MSSRGNEWDLGYFKKGPDRRSLPNRTIAQRLTAWELGRDYYDGDRSVGYGGFTDDGRWNLHVQKLIHRYRIPQDGLVVELGCKKGFALVAFKKALRRAKFLGIENHPYPLEYIPEDLRDSVIMGPLYKVPLMDDSVDFLLSFSAIYMQNLGEIVMTLREIERVSRGRSYITVGAYRDESERKCFAAWTLIGTTFLHVDEWLQVFDYAGYSGDFYFTTPESLGLLVQKEPK